MRSNSPPPVAPASMSEAQHALERLPEEWAAKLSEWGEPSYRAEQIFRWLHERGVVDAQAMSNLPKSLRARLSQELVAEETSVLERHHADDETDKLLLQTHDGRRIETVLIPEVAAGERRPEGRITQCVSSQVGCAMACAFCASGVAGLKRHLSAAEIVAQVAAGARHVSAQGRRLHRLVFMGMGEPLHNYPALARSLALLTHPAGYGFSIRRLTVSTSGLVPQIDQLARDFGGRVPLAISLHAPDDERRSQLMPINRRYPLPELMAALRRYPMPKRARLTVEYTLIAGVNERPSDAAALVRLFRGLPIKVNLIPMNPVQDVPFTAPPETATRRFQRVVQDAGVPCFVRIQRGDEIAAACGQLALAGERRKIRLPSLASP